MEVMKMSNWMLQLQESDKRLVEMASEHAESTTYVGTVREALIHYLDSKSGDTRDAE